MKKVLFVFSLAGLKVLAACNNQNTKNRPEQSNVSGQVVAAAPVMTFSGTVHDFGKRVQDEVVKYSFRFKNTGKSDLKIARISTSCGCTVGKYPHESVKPGEEDSIEVIFNSAYKMGYQNKSIILPANTKPERTVLRIKASVVPQHDK